tara:strand:+ start:1204 stop:1458 length:255 start_codon:yes stop_codon:yes gene_type:complete
MWTVFEGAVMGRWPRGEETRSANDGAVGGVTSVGLNGANRVGAGIGSIIASQYMSIEGIEIDYYLVHQSRCCPVYLSGDWWVGY